jgi:hypothetical protein
MEATCLQEPGLEAHLVKFNYLISYQDRDHNVASPKTASKYSIISSSSLSRHKLETNISNSAVPDSCLQLDRKLKLPPSAARALVQSFKLPPMAA